MNAELIVLGSGTSVPHPRRTSPANWLETKQGSVLLDIGCDAPHRMAQENLDWGSLDAIWVSHFHLDHMGGLAPFLFSLKWAPQTASREKPLRIFGPLGLAQLVKTIDDSNNYRLLSQRFEIEIVEVAPDSEFEILPDALATTARTPHTQESLALKLTVEDGKSVVYTSDTGYSEELIGFLEDTNLLVLECSFRRNKPIQTHLELQEAIQLGQASSAKRLVLTHLYPEWDGIDVVTEARAFSWAEIIEATDGLRLEI